MVTYSAREHEIREGGTSGNEVQSSTMQQFIRIANARLLKRYGFEPQRRAIAAKMFMQWLDRKGKES